MAPAHPTILNSLLAADRRLRWVVVGLWMTVIFLASADSASGYHSSTFLHFILDPLGIQLSSAQLDVLHHLARKGGHFSEYFILALLLFWALPSSRWRWMAAWAIASAYAGTDELHQRFVPGRGPAIADIGIDSGGALAALLLKYLTGRRPLK